MNKKYTRCPNSISHEIKMRADVKGNRAVRLELKTSKEIVFLINYTTQ